LQVKLCDPCLSASSQMHSEKKLVQFSFPLCIEPATSCDIRL